MGFISVPRRRRGAGTPQPNYGQAWSRRGGLSIAGAFARRWTEPYHGAVDCLRDDRDQLLACFRYQDPAWRKRTRTANAIERRFRQVRRRTRPMGVFADNISMERILFAVFTYENQSQGVGTAFPLTQNS